MKRLCDTATILRGGKWSPPAIRRQETAASLARMMVGAEIGEVKRAGEPPDARCRGCVVNDLTLAPDDPHGVRLERHLVRGRAARSSASPASPATARTSCSPRCRANGWRTDPGTVVIDGSAAGQLSITAAPQLGAAFVPEERLGHGAVPRMRLSENALLTGHAASGMVQHGFVDTAATLNAVDRATKAFDVRKAKRDPEAASLSGGNLQKFIVGREILRNPAVLVVSQPTWGVDAGAAAAIRQALLDLAAARRRRAGDQPGPRRAVRDLRPHRGDVPRPAVRPLPTARSQPREARPADGRQHARAEGGRRCSWCLRSAPSARTPSRWSRRLIAIALTIVTMSILFALLGKNPLSALHVYFIAPLDRRLFAAGARGEGDAAGADRVGLSLCYRANVWNIGAEGQFLIGAIAGSWLAVTTHGTDAGHWVLPAMLVLGAPAACSMR